MIDKGKIPEPTYNELVEMFGKDKAEEIIIKCNYNFRRVSNKILTEHIVRKYKLHRIADWIIQEKKLKASIIIIVLVISATLVYIFWPNLFK
jgi:hypothetical protein